jgi:hypothetical protein
MKNFTTTSSSFSPEDFIVASVFIKKNKTNTNTTIKLRREITASGDLKIVKVRMIPIQSYEFLPDFTSDL